MGIYEVIYGCNYKFNAITIRHDNLVELTSLFTPLYIEGVGQVHVIAILDITEPEVQDI
ncbi:hypothetical protein DIEEDFHO_00015 [Enterococcus phage vB_OCPT_Bill]|uniref:Uncharacterized protein n=1 Tax=Enterococcus phage vB_OCPT_Bill TaxID=2922322 RepID=A0AAE9K7N7_9CAUD|nr:hypothetical protein DIEEDFHO_00015 [Enterococcus phage vB_OCPT_Bill]